VGTFGEAGSYQIWTYPSPEEIFPENVPLEGASPCTKTFSNENISPEDD
jgi:hypothetical protein